MPDEWQKLKRKDINYSMVYQQGFLNLKNGEPGQDITIELLLRRTLVLSEPY